MLQRRSLAALRNRAKSRWVRKAFEALSIDRGDVFRDPRIGGLPASKSDAVKSPSTSCLGRVRTRSKFVADLEGPAKIDMETVI